MDAKEANARKLLTPALREKVEKRVRECLDIATLTWPEHTAKFQDAVDIRYDIKNRFGGVAISGGRDDWTIRLNLILCYENEEDFIEQTVGHEVAHLIQHVVFGFTKQVVEKGETKTKKVMAHGKEWRQVMGVLGLKAARCHTYDTSSIDIKKRPRSKKGQPLTLQGLLDMQKRLQTGFKRLPPSAMKDFMEWAEAHANGDTTGEDE